MVANCPTLRPMYQNQNQNQNQNHGVLCNRLLFWMLFLVSDQKIRRSLMVVDPFDLEKRPHFFDFLSIVDGMYIKYWENLWEDCDCFNFQRIVTSVRIRGCVLGISNTTNMTTNTNGSCTVKFPLEIWNFFLHF